MEELKQKIKAEIETIYSNQSTNTQRQAAQQFCEELRVRPDAPVIANDLFQSYTDNHQLLFFALGLLESVIRFRFSEKYYSENELAQILAIGCQLMTRVSTSSSSYPEFIQLKVCKVFVELLHYTLPLNFPQFFPFLDTVLSHSPKLGIRVIHQLSQDVFMFPNKVTTERKDDLRNSLVALLSPHNSPFVPADFFNLLSIPVGSSGLLSYIIHVLEAPSTVSALKILCLNTLESVMEWIPYQILQNLNITILLLKYLNYFDDAEVQTAACDALTSLCSRPFSDFSTSLAVITNPMLSTEGVNLIMSAWNRIQRVESVDEFIDSNYPLISRICQMWTEFGNHQLCWKKVESLPVGFDAFLSVSLELLKHPSLATSTLILSLFGSVFRHEILNRSTTLNNIVLIQLTDFIVTQRLVKSMYVPSDDDNAPLSAKCSHADFASDLAEFQSAFSTFRVACSSIIKLCTDNHLLHAFDLCSGMVTSLLEVPVPTQIKLTTKSDYYLVWEAVVFLLSSVLSSTTVSKLINNKHSLTGTDMQSLSLVAEKVRMMIENLMKFQISDANVLGKNLEAITCFSGFFTAETSQLALSVLYRVFQFVTFLNTGESINTAENISEDSMALRRKSISCLIRLASSLPEFLLSLYKEITTEISRLFASNLVLYGEKASLYEFEAAIIFNSKSLPLDQKLAYFSTIFQESISSAIDQELTGYIANVESFKSAIGLEQMLQRFSSDPSLRMPLDDSCKMDIVKARMRRAKIGFVIACYKGCLQRTTRIGNTEISTVERKAILESSSWVINLPSFLPLFAQIIKNIHAIWELESRYCGSQLESFFDLGVLEKKVALGMSMTEAAEENYSSNKQITHSQYSSADQFEEIRRWLQQQRENLYALFESMAYLNIPDLKGFYSIDGLADVLLGSLFNEHLKNHHWRSLTHHFVKAFVLFTPSEHYGHLDRIFPPYLDFIGRKLAAEWNAQLQKSNSLAGGAAGVPSLFHLGSSSDELDRTQGDAEVTNEILELKLLTMLTREWSDLHSAIFLAGKETASVKKMPTATSTSQESLNKLGASVCRPAPDFGIRESLVIHLLSTPTIVRPLLNFVTLSLKWRDTRTATQSARLLARIIPILIDKPDAQMFFAHEVTVAVLEALSDGYHQEGQDMLIALLTDLYVYLRTTPAAQAFAAVLQKVPRFSALEQFDSFIMQDASSSSQRRLMREWLRDFLGVKVSEKFKVDQPSSSSTGAVKITKMIREIEESAKADAASHRAHDHVQNIGQLFEN